MSEERAVQTMSCFLRESQELTYVLDGDSLKDVVTLIFTTRSLFHGKCQLSA